MTALAAGSQTPRLIEKAQLHRFVTIALGRPNLQHVAGASLNHRHRHDVALLVVNLRHSYFATQNSWDACRRRPSLVILKLVRAERETRGLAPAYPPNFRGIVKY